MFSILLTNKIRKYYKGKELFRKLEITSNTIDQMVEFLVQRDEINVENDQKVKICKEYLEQLFKSNITFKNYPEDGNVFITLFEEKYSTKFRLMVEIIGRVFTKKYPERSWGWSNFNRYNQVSSAAEIFGIME